MQTITPAEMKELETRFMQETGVPGILLMEHAARGVCAALARHVRREATVLFLCGPGNNGGDGYAAARLWKAQGGKALIIELSADAKGDAKINRDLALLADIPVRLFGPEDELPPADAIVDALFGTGLARRIEDAAAHLIHCANDMRIDRGAPVIAVDIPSGVDGTTGEILGWQVISADETVTFHRIKQGLLLGDAPDYTGRITVQPILIPLGGEHDGAYSGMEVLTPADLWEDLFARPAVCHKGDFGRVAILCGSRGMAGAAALCANAALRTGAGLVNILCRESLLPILQTLSPGATCTVLPEKDGQLQPGALPLVRDTLDRADAACIGCGLGQAPDVLPLLRLFAGASCPVVWDADALNLIARMDGMLPLKEADVITPHPGEAARLLDCDPDEVAVDTLAALDRLHDLCGCTVLLKGARTLITSGIDRFCNMYASPALAKGGSGDVLAGIITALLARRLPECYDCWFDSAHAAAYGALIHGLAGLRAEKLRGENCTLPTDIIDCIRLDAQGLD